jgi:hypothetical protein
MLSWQDALVRRSGLPRRSDGPWVLTKPVKFLEPRKILGGYLKNYEAVKIDTPMSDFSCLVGAPTIAILRFMDPRFITIKSYLDGDRTTVATNDTTCQMAFAGDTLLGWIKSSGISSNC